MSGPKQTKVFLSLSRDKIIIIYLLRQTMSAFIKTPGQTVVRILWKEQKSSIYGGKMAHK